MIKDQNSCLMQQWKGQFISLFYKIMSCLLGRLTQNCLSNASTKQEQAFCVLEFAPTHTRDVLAVQQNFRTKFRKDHFHRDCVDPWVRQLETTWFVYKTNVSRSRTPEKAEETIIAAKIATNANSTCSQYDRFFKCTVGSTLKTANI